MARYLLITTIAFLTCLSYQVVAERFYQYRDHRDQSKYLLSKQETNVVNSTFDAEIQLEKYGYLRCRVRRKRRSLYLGMGGNVVEENISQMHHPVEEELPLCSTREVRNAIKQYQKTYKLPETGVVDEETKRFMSTVRCGNADNDKKKEEEKKSDVAKVSDVLSKDDHFKKISKNTNSNRPWKRSAKNTILMQSLTANIKSRNSVLPDYRRKYLHEYINKLKEEDPLFLRSVSEEERQKRSVVAITHVNKSDTATIWDGQKFTKRDILWRLLDTGFSTRIPVAEQRASLTLAFRMWSEVIPVRFEEENSGDIRSVDIEIAFGRGSHQNCDRRFDGHGGEIAHSWSGRNVHFDDEEDYKSIESLNMDKDGIYLLRVAVHEIGHVLGLTHTDKPYSIMYAIYHQKFSPDKQFELGWEDRKQVQQLYGVCKGRFSAVFDWVRKRPDNQFIFNTYFFRENHYWMYENHANRTRYGDPLYISREWKGVPNDIDGYLHVWYFAGNIIVDKAFFFKGTKYYKYHSENDEVYEGWPRLIAEDFGPKSGETGGVPDNLDSVFFDKRDRNIYFFKGEWVYVFDPKAPPETRGCCVRKSKIIEEFPTAQGEKIMDGNVDSVYYSYKAQSQYFFKGEDVWQNVLFHPRQKQIRNSLKYIGKWYEKWFDICDVRRMQEIPSEETGENGT